ncbi:SGNH/GDSL hydrolase family protein [Gordonia polyisoprenivorans]|uniref:SGNH/GDSL hydrolase family protein n=1 Tax=Gordonia polyisoprenivorans TaxID=84595 RepID=UPI003D160295
MRRRRGRVDGRRTCPRHPWTDLCADHLCADLRESRRQLFGRFRCRADGTGHPRAMRTIGRQLLPPHRAAVRLSPHRRQLRRRDHRRFLRGAIPGPSSTTRRPRPGTDLVTFMIGGNDGMVFAGTVGKCLAAAATTLGRGSPCKDTYGDTIANEIRAQTFPKLVNAMRAIRSKAPHARIAVIGYPWIMPATYEPCPAFPVAAGDVAYTYDIQATINDAIRRAATETGVTFVDATTPSVGHDSCKPVGTRWIEPILTTQQIVPVHPNALGERELASIATAALGLGR